MDNSLSLYEILKRPVITEKSHEMSELDNKYVFEVDLRANKIQIADAVFRIFDVDVLDVHTMIVPPKRGQRGRRVYVRRKKWKKAIVTIRPGQTIGLFNM